jgi:alanyl-tRNA synthetase
MTQRLYYRDAYGTRFQARVVEIVPGNPARVYLDRTLFYPTSGGQPHDVGRLGGASVLDVVDEEERVAHLVAGDVVGSSVEGEIDWVRRYDHMQQHSGQHLLSALFADSLGHTTLSVHFGAAMSTLDLDTGSLSATALATVERRANEVVWENRPIAVTFEDAVSAQGLRKPPPRAGELRVVSIADLDRSACGGTHVRSTAEIGTLLLRRSERVKQGTRVEFVCGGRAVARARADFTLLAGIAQRASTAIDDVSAAVEAQGNALRDAESQRRRLQGELDVLQARALYERTGGDSLGVRRAVHACAPDTTLESVRGLALAFAELPKALFLAHTTAPPSLLLAAAADSGVNAGEVLRAAVLAAGGRGGGSPRLAQGTVPSVEALQRVVAGLGA